jgi:hypothetical protein
MPESQTYHLHPYGWEDDPEEERFKLSTLDYLSACTYNMYALFFRLDESLSSTAVEALKAGLERTLSQARHLCGTIEKDSEKGQHGQVCRAVGRQRPSVPIYRRDRSDSLLYRTTR